ncbi:MAG TPA: hypothetical protein VGJ73_12755, partial [Verrucomicrobiae bacterium]
MKANFIPCLVLLLIGVFTSGDIYAAIVYPVAPDGGQQIVYKNVRSFLDRNVPCLSERGLHIEQIKIAAPYRDYGLWLKALASGHMLSFAQNSGAWVYLLMHDTNSVGMEELMTDKKTGALKFNGLYESDFSNETLEALHMAEQLPQVKKQDYEIRRLDCAPLLFVAVWLHEKTDDIIIPLPNTFGRWLAYHPYPEGEILKLLKPEAEKKMQERPGMV